MNRPKLIRYVLLALSLLLITPVAFCNTIDDLKTDDDILMLLSRIGAFNGSDPIPVMPTDILLKKLKCSELATNWKVKAWEKIDFNNDKLTDLIVTVKDLNRPIYVFAIIDKGQGGLKCLNVSRGFDDEDCQLFKPVTINDKQMLLYYSNRVRLINGKFNFENRDQIDTLVYLYDDFVEYNRKPANYVIKSIAMSGGDSIKISADGKAIYKIRTAHSNTEVFNGTIPLDILSEIKSEINYIDIKKLRGIYQVTWSDDAEAFLRIEFADGSVKSIYDYGMIGTFGLTRLYGMLIDIKRKTNWTPAKN